MSDNDRVLALLQQHEGEWVDRPYSRLPVMWHSRVASLRKQGHNIEAKCFGQGDWRYRLVPKVRIGAGGQLEMVAI